MGEEEEAEPAAEETNVMTDSDEPSQVTPHTEPTDTTEADTAFIPEELPYDQEPEGTEGAMELQASDMQDILAMQDVPDLQDEDLQAFLDEPNLPLDSATDERDGGTLGQNSTGGLMGAKDAGQGEQKSSQDVPSAPRPDLLPGEGLGLVTLQDLAEDSVQEQPLVLVRKPKKEPRRKAKSKMIPDPKWNSVSPE